MTRVTISELRAHLDAYLARATAGETVIVCDRETVVARIEPAADADDLVPVREPLIADPQERARVRRSIKPVVHLSDEDAKRAQAIIDDMRADRF